MFGFAPNPLQQDLMGELPGLVEEGGPGLVLATAPTGDGKTEAALFAATLLGRAAGCRGLYPPFEVNTLELCRVVQRVHLVRHGGFLGVPVGGAGAGAAGIRVDGFRRGHQQKKGVSVSRKACFTGQ